MTTTLDQDIVDAFAAHGLTPDARPPKRQTAPGYVDMTPTYRDLLPALVAVLENGTPEGRRLARHELFRMAAVADLYNLTAGSR